MPPFTLLFFSPTVTVSAGTNLQAPIDALAHTVVVLPDRKLALCASSPIATRNIALQPYLDTTPDRTCTTRTLRTLFSG